VNAYEEDVARDLKNPVYRRARALAELQEELEQWEEWAKGYGSVTLKKDDLRIMLGRVQLVLDAFLPEDQ
jgi:hypothetical protein